MARLAEARFVTLLNYFWGVGLCVCFFCWFCVFFVGLCLFAGVFVGFALETKASGQLLVSGPQELHQARSAAMHQTRMEVSSFGAAEKTKEKKSEAKTR